MHWVLKVKRKPDRSIDKYKGHIVAQGFSQVQGIHYNKVFASTACSSLDTIVHIWDIAMGTLLNHLRGHDDSVYSVAFTPDGKGLVSGSLHNMLKLLDLNMVVNNMCKAGEVVQQERAGFHRPQGLCPLCCDLA